MQTTDATSASSPRHDGDDMHNYTAYLLARNAAEYFLLAHARESDFSAARAVEGFQKLAKHIGYRAEKIEENSTPFTEGELVRIKGNDHLGVHRVNSCEWFDRTKPGTPAYWLCDCSEIRDPIDWSKIPAGATGIVTSASWRGSAEHLERVASLNSVRGAS